MKIGVLGGGQLGRLFLQNAANYPFEIKVLDPDAQAPCAGMCEFVQGDFRDAKTVAAFGADCEAIGIEIEHVSLSGLRTLERQGKRVVPNTRALSIIQDKGKQKVFYAKNGIPTAPFYLVERAEEVDKTHLPFVQKTRFGGYDGKGVQVILNEQDLHKLWECPAVIEKFVPIAREVSVVVARDGAGNMRAYPVMDMVFDPLLNLVDVVQVPSILPEPLQYAAAELALRVVAALDSAGVFAVELFLTTDNQLWVNETACRVHNSGHLTIEACVSSQFDQMWRVLADMPLGNTDIACPVAMLNIVGAENQTGKAKLPYLKELLAIPNVFVHWYGKAQTRAGRKMGHVTILASTVAELEEKCRQVKPFLETCVDE